MNHTPLSRTLSRRQTDILVLLYRFRFLTRPHIQAILNHSHHSRILSWLNTLTEQTLILQSFDKKFISAPAVYSLGATSRSYLKLHSDVKGAVLNRIWRESSYTAQFRHHCLFLADVYLALVSLTTKTKAKLRFYTKTDLYGINDLILPHPDAYVAIEEVDGTINRYFLDLFDEIPAKALRKRVKQYFDYYSSNEWQDATDKPFPEIILVCPNDRLKHHLYYYIQKKLEEDEDAHFYLTTREMVASKGFQSGVLQRVIMKD